MSSFKLLPLLLSLLLTVTIAVATETDPDSVLIPEVTLPTADQDKTHDQIVATTEPSTNSVTTEDVQDTDSMQSDSTATAEIEKEDMAAEATGTIDQNLINSNYVGKYNSNPCQELGTSVINLLSCCSFTAGPLDTTNVRKCCLAQGSNCNYNPNACCNYLQTACLPDPILSGIYTCQKTDNYRPRVAPIGYNLPTGYLPNNNYAGAGTNYGTGNNYAGATNYGAANNYAGTGSNYAGNSYGAGNNYAGAGYGAGPNYAGAGYGAGPNYAGAGAGYGAGPNYGTGSGYLQ